MPRLAPSSAWFLLLCMVAACGGGATVSPPPAPPPGPPAPPPPPPSPVTSATVDVRSNSFVPETVVLTVGGTVTWRWVGSGHTVTSVLSPTFVGTSSIQNAGFQLGPVTFSQPGTYHYICTVHGSVSGNQTSGMQGTIIVQ